jgi:hypothetical protein
MNGYKGAAALSSDRRICGLSHKTFIILVAAAIIIAAAALGGGLGSGLSANKATAPTLSSALPSTSSSNADTAVTAKVGTVNGSPTTLYHDCPASNNSLYSIEYSSTTYAFWKMCNSVFTNLNQGPSRVNVRVSSLNDYVNLCAAWNENNITKGNEDQVCSVVCWRYGFIDDDLLGQCFGYTTSNTTGGGFNVQSDNLCDGAAWINYQVHI